VLCQTAAGNMPVRAWLKSLDPEKTTVELNTLLEAARALGWQLRVDLRWRAASNGQAARMKKP